MGMTLRPRLLAERARGEGKAGRPKTLNEIEEAAWRRDDEPATEWQRWEQAYQEWIDHLENGAE